MNDLKQEIARIQQAVKENQDKYPGVNKWYEITKVAYERGELVKLLSGEDEYIYDADGELWLKPLAQNFSKDPIDVVCLFTGLSDLYFNEKYSDAVKDKLVRAFHEMVSGTAVQLYFAVKMFVSLCERLNAKSSYFYDYFSKEQLSDELYPIITNAVINRFQEMKTVFIYDCSHLKDGLYTLCVNYSKFLEDVGLNGFIEVK